ncbi:MAG: gamma-glutamylcyclotransferase [Betaproteobacteria bacterium]|nr:gamma-glutamylcyclotransferase [Betaproteobacteria bacterium]MDH5537176.1 gamma-glutamylcyclotransferase [Betaproteobacteria bacterium]
MTTVVSRASDPWELGLRHGDLWIFGYGSLMWDPGFPHVQWAPALVHGYHRALCISSNRWRGTPKRPGLVLGLDRGGACRGIAFRVLAGDVATTLEALWAREMRRRIYQPKLLRARLMDRDVRALAFVADPAHAEYAGHLTIEETAVRVANCRGARGPNIDYLSRTIDHLAELGVRDHYLLRVLAAARAVIAAPRHG